MFAYMQNDPLKLCSDIKSVRNQYPTRVLLGLISFAWWFVMFRTSLCSVPNALLPCKKR